MGTASVNTHRVESATKSEIHSNVNLQPKLEVDY